MISSSRRGFLRGLAGVSLLSAGGCFTPHPRKPGQKVRLAAVGVMGKGYSDWTPMLKTGLVEMVAFCDADANMLPQALEKAKKDFPDLDLSKVPFYTDYRKLLDDADKLGIDAMTISTPDHVHAPVAIQAMKKGIHVYVQKPLVRTLWELEYFEKTARENGVIVQMGNQGSSLNSMRRCTEVLQSGILGDVREVHVWTNRPVWPQGKGVADWVKSHPKGDPIRKGLNWDAWLATAADRPFLDQYPKDADVYDPWNLGKNVYHTFTWRGFFDFGAGAFGDMACHTMNLAFRGLELGGVSDAECTMIESQNDVAYPLKSIVKLTYRERDSKVRPGVKLPAVTLYWYDGNEKPKAELMPKWAAKNGGKVPNTGCLMIGSKGQVLMQDDYGAKCAIALEADTEFKDVFQHEAAKAVARSIPFCGQASSAGDGKSSVEMKGFAEGHYGEFINAIFGNGPYYEQTHSRCFADIEYCIPQMEGILVGCVAQRLPGVKLGWCSKKQKFDVAAANAFVKPYIRKGFEF
ncbi:MAG: Gfo/Idh/MocA family oxidoreductase [Kiritimatiellae bacterium]|nr:Gfo/Idh/MocA family oxidoreductase [Kiritimatiellia bacterium]